jgi:hypothetical protein
VRTLSSSEGRALIEKYMQPSPTGWTVKPLPPRSRVEVRVGGCGDRSVDMEPS